MTNILLKLSTREARKAGCIERSLTVLCRHGIDWNEIEYWKIGSVERKRNIMTGIKVTKQEDTIEREKIWEISFSEEEKTSPTWWVKRKTSPTWRVKKVKPCWWKKSRRPNTTVKETLNYPVRVLFRGLTELTLRAVSSNSRSHYYNKMTLSIDTFLFCILYVSFH